MTDAFPLSTPTVTMDVLCECIHDNDENRAT